MREIGNVEVPQEAFLSVLKLDDEQVKNMENRREKLIKNVLDLSINCGKVNENADYILYSEENKEKRKEKINEIKKNLEEIIKNTKNIAEALELSLK